MKNKNKKILDLSKNTILFAISSFGTKFISFFLISLYTSVLNTGEYGIVDIITTTVQLLIPLLTFNIQDAVLRFSLDEQYNSEDVLNVGFRMVGISSIILGVILAVLNKMIFYKIGLNYLLFLYVSFLCGAVNNILSMYLKAKNMVKELVFWGGMNTIVTFVTNIFLLRVIEMGVNGYIIAFVSGTLIANIGMFISGKIFNALRQSEMSRKLVVSMLTYSFPLIVNSLGWWITNASDRYILTFFCGAVINGIYAVSYKIPSILSAVQSIFYNAWSISAIKEFDKDDSDGFIGKVYSAYGMGTVFVCSLIMMANVYIAQLLYSNDFFQAWKYVPFLLVGTAFYGMGLFVGCIYTAAKETKLISITTVIAALINILLNIIFIPLFKASGAAIATMIGYFSCWLVRIIWLKKLVHVQVEWYKQILCIVMLIGQSIIASNTDKLLYQLPCFFIISIVGYKGLIDICKKMGMMTRNNVMKK